MSPRAFVFAKYASKVNCLYFSNKPNNYPRKSTIRLITQERLSQIMTNNVENYSYYFLTNSKRYFKYDEIYIECIAYKTFESYPSSYIYLICNLMRLLVCFFKFFNKHKNPKNHQIHRKIQMY